MSIFSRIRDSIFGHKTVSVTKPLTPAKPATPVAAAPAAAAPVAAAKPAPAPVDVEKVLLEMMESKGNPNLNWRTSVADLMRLLDLDPSLANRKELAVELGYTGATDGSAEMNIWLYKAVMKALAANGGKVPASLDD
jgi:3-oxoacyl-ACP reductase-like protein